MPISSISATTTEYVRSAINSVSKKVNTGNVLVMGIATSGPINTPVTITTKEDAYAVFGKDIVEVHSVSASGTSIILKYIPNAIISIQAYNTTTKLYEPALTIKDTVLVDNTLSFTSVELAVKLKIVYNVAYDKYSLIPKLTYLFDNGITSVTAMRIAGEHAVAEIPSVALTINATNQSRSYRLENPKIVRTGSVTLEEATNTVTKSSHGIQDNSIVYFTTISGTTGITVNTKYYVINAGENTFNLAATYMGEVITLTTDGSGTLTYYTDTKSSEEETLFNNCVGMRVYKNDDTFSISATILDVSEDGLELVIDTQITDPDLLGSEWIIGYPIIIAIADAGSVNTDTTDKHYVAFRKLMRNRLALTLHSPTWSDYSDTLIYLDEHQTLGSLVSAINRRYIDSQSEFVAFTPDPFSSINFQQYLYYLTEGNFGTNSTATFGCDIETWYDDLYNSFDYVRIRDYNAVEFTVYNTEQQVG